VFRCGEFCLYIRQQVIINGSNIIKVAVSGVFKLSSILQLSLILVDCISHQLW